MEEFNEKTVVDQIKNNWNSHLKYFRLWGYIASVLMILVGALCVAFPIQTTYGVELFVTAALLVFGAWEIVHYIQSPAVLRSGAFLLSGILNVLLGILLITMKPEAMLATFGILFGFNMTLVGVEQLVMSGRLRAFQTEGTGWLTLDGVLNLICGVILLFSPVISIFAVSFMLSLYLIVGGISLFIQCNNAKVVK